MPVFLFSSNLVGQWLRWIMLWLENGNSLPLCAGTPGSLQACRPKHGHGWKRGFGGTQLPSLVSPLLRFLWLMLLFWGGFPLCSPPSIYSEIQTYMCSFFFASGFLAKGEIVSSPVPLLHTGLAVKASQACNSGGGTGKEIILLG